jgi:hypothetical protein
MRAKRLMILVFSGCLLLALTFVALASPEALTLEWWTVDGGGLTFGQGGEYTLGGTAGQPDAGVMSGGEYTLGGGFWRGGAVATADYRVYLPVVMRGS